MYAELFDGKYRLYRDGRIIRIRKDGTEGKEITVYTGSTNTTAQVRISGHTLDYIQLLIDNFLDKGKSYEVANPDLPITVDNLREVEWVKGKEYEYKGHIGKIWSEGIVVFKNGSVLYTREQRITYGSKDSGGYMKVHVNGQQVKVHRMVAELYIDKVEGKDTVNHINENKTDNRVENLEWVSLAENTKEYVDLRNNRLVKLVAKQKEELTIASKALQKEKKEVDRLKKELNKKIKEINKLQQQAITTATMQNLAVASHQTYVQRRKQTTKSVIGKPVKVNGKQYDTIRSAANYIAAQEPGKRVETIRKEIRKYLRGERTEWYMYGKYYISS